MPLAKPAWPILQWGDPLSVGLVGAWPFHEGSGPILNDLSGKGNNGALTSGPTWIGGQFGSSVKMASISSQYIDCGNNPSLQITGAITISAWINITSVNGVGIGNIIVAKDNDTGGRAYTLDYNSSAQPRFYVNGGGASLVTGSALATAQWHHIVASFIPSGPMAMYVNGSSVATSTAGDASIPSATTNCRIGARAYAGFQDYVNASFASVQIWNRALSSAEITQLYSDSFSIYRPKRRLPWFTAVAASDTLFAQACL